MNENQCQTASLRVLGVYSVRWRSVYVSFSGKSSVEVSLSIWDKNCLFPSFSLYIAFLKLS
jgi:hypothetical protein